MRMLKSLLLSLLLLPDGALAQVVYPYFSPGGALSGTGTSQNVNVGAGSPFILGTLPEANTALAVKPAVTVVATSNQTLSGLPTVDGTATAAGSLILNTAQSTGSQNGPWVAAVGAWTRPTWYASGSTTQAFQFVTTFVRLGTLYQGSTWRLTTANPITVDTTATTWAQTPLALNATSVTGTLPAAQMPALTGDVTSTVGTVATAIGANAVTNAKLAQMAANTLKGNNTAGVANAADLTVAQVQALLAIAASANPSAVVGLTAVNGSAATYLRSDAAPALSVAIAPNMTGLWNFTHTGATTPAPITINSSLNMLQLAGTRARTTGGNYMLLTDPTGQKGCIGFCSSGSDDFYFENDLPSATHIYSNGIDRIGLDANGGIFMNQPTGAGVNTLLINLPVGQYGLLVGSNSITAGNSFGVEIQAGTNTTDTSLAIINQAATLTYFKVRGDGEIFGGGPVAAGQVDMTPDTSTFTITYTGMTAATTCTASWSRMGLVAVLTLCAATGTSNSTAFTATGVPAAIQPATLTQQVIPLSQPAVTNNGSAAAAPIDVVVANSGTLTFRFNGSTAGFAAANAKGFANALTLTYQLK